MVVALIAFLSNKPVVVTSLQVEAPGGGGGSYVTVVATWVSAMATGRGPLVPCLQKLINLKILQPVSSDQQGWVS